MFVKRMREEEDRLSQLPDSVALHILSFLSMKDAARTSTLSKIWRRLWLHADFFDFDAYGVFKRPAAKYFTIPENVTKYVEWVSNVLRSHRESTDYEGKPLVLRKLRIHMCLIQQFQMELDEWLSYAFTRGVQSLELDFTFCCLPRCVFSGRFPDGTDFNSLRSLSLFHVDVTGEVINSLLCNFPFLERLKVHHSPTLESLTVCGSSLALKHLDISFCISLRHLTVRDTSLVTLAIHCVAELVLFNNPKLVVLRASEWRYPKLEQLSDCLSTVQNFAFDATYSDHLEDINKVPRLREVKQLTLIVDPLLEDSLIRLAALLSLSPKLEKLVLQFEYVRRSYPGKKMVLSTVSTRFPVQQRVKVVEVRGYYGYVAENEALMYVLHHAMVPPGRVIFNPHNLHRDLNAPISYFRVEYAIRTSAKKQAELLKTVLPSSVVFSVI